MTLHISWLPNGHVVHGYRKVFVIHDSNGYLKGVVTFAPMGYETAYQVLETAQSRQDFQGIDIDPALLWGLSLLVQQLEHQEDFLTDDGYVKLRPAPVEASRLIAALDFQQAVKQGFFALDD